MSEPVPPEPAIREAGDLDRVAELARACERCPLHESRTRAVPGEGPPDARVMLVGEAPGAREDESGRPFVGRAGSILDGLLERAGLDRSRIFITNVLKSRPPENRDPRPDEVAACRPYLERQIALIEPELIVTVGLFAARALTGSRASLKRIREGSHRYRGVAVIPTYHPSALFRKRAWREAAEADFDAIGTRLEAGP